jgi:hypothetical protein
MLACCTQSSVKVVVGDVRKKKFHVLIGVQGFAEVKLRNTPGK